MSIPRPTHRLIPFSPRVKKSSLPRASFLSRPATSDLIEKIQLLALANPDGFKILSNLADDYLADLTATRAALPEAIKRRLRVLVIRQQRKQSTGG